MHAISINSINTRMGISYLAYLYNQLIKHPDYHLNLVACHQNRILGVVTISYNLRQTQTLIKQSLKFRHALTFLGQLIKNPLQIKELISRIYLEHCLISDFSTPYITIITLFVAPDCRRQGIGNKILVEVVRRLKSRYFRQLYVDTDSQNVAALTFYKNNGFVPIKNILNNIILKLELP